MRHVTITAAALIFLAAAATGALPAPPEYTVMRTTGAIVIDGVLDEADWAKAEPVGDFAFPWYESGVKEQTEAKMLWDDTYLYVAFRCDDSNIWADHYDTNAATYRDDCAEIFWNPNPGAGDMYYMFEMNCIGNLLSVHNNFVDKFGDRAARVMTPRIGRKIVGSVNSDHDYDTGWTLEVAIRFDEYPELSKRTAPLPGDMWRVGLNRCGGKTNPQYSQWSPSQTERPNFHVPADFGRVFFSELPAGSPTGVDTNEDAVEPRALELLGVTPNPFNASTLIAWRLAEPSPLTLSIHDSTGRKVRTLVDGTLPAGTHTALWRGMDDNGDAVSSGLYFTRIASPGRTVSGKMVLVK